MKEARVCPVKNILLLTTYQVPEIQHAQITQKALVYCSLMTQSPILHLWLRRLMLARIHLTAILIERPKRVLEQTVRIVLLLKFHKALPVLAKGGGHPRGELVSSKELRIGPLQMRTLVYTVS